MNIGDKINGFELDRVEYIDEVQSEVYSFTHIKTKAKLLKFKNDDKNKVFMTAFRTLPKDDTGVMHIIEHCVLSGSRKYKTKEPFIDLSKTSLATFLNAITYQDKTTYPIASRNDKDFYNLCDVYLDSVFFPKLLHEKKVFLQEGWRYELKDKKDDIKYQGVVFNEMRGAVSSTDDYIIQEMDSIKYKDFYMGKNSGGDPYAIPNLTYEDFKAYYLRYYHPSNSYIYFYGNGNTKDELKHVNEYLDQFEYKNPDNDISENYVPDGDKRIDGSYPVEKSDNKSLNIFSYNINTGRAYNIKDVLLSALLSRYLTYFSSSPLKEKLFKEKIAKEIFGTSSLLYNYNVYSDLSLIAKEAEEKNLERFKEIVDECLDDIVDGNIKPMLYESVLNTMEFSLKSYDHSNLKGIIILIRTMCAWIYDKDIYDYLRYQEVLDELKSNKNILSDFVREHRKEGALLFNFSPKKGLFEEKDEEQKNFLKKYKESLSEEELDELIKMNMELEKYQSAPDSKEALKSIPTVDISDIKREIDIQEIAEIEKDLYFSKENTNDIVHLNFLFNTDHIDVKDYSRLSFLCEILKDSASEKYSREELENLIYIYSNGISISPVYINNVKTKECKSYIFVKVKFLRKNSKKIFELLEEVLLNAKTDDKKVVEEILQESVSYFESCMNDMGPSLALNRVLSYSDLKSYLKEKTSGFDFYFYKKALNDNFEEEYDEEISKIKDIYSKAFRKDNLIIQYCLDKIDENINEDIRNFKEKFKALEFDIKEKTFKEDVKNEAALSDSNVNHVCSGYSLSALNEKVDGDIYLLSNILVNDYLHTEIRAKGGAYGDDFTASRETVSFYSYRDPHIERTLDVYRKTSDFIRNMDIDEDELNSRKVRTSVKFDPNLVDGEKGFISLISKLSGIEKEDLLKEYLCMLDAKIEDLKKYADLIDKVCAKNAVCCYGNKKQILELNEEKHIFKNFIETI